MILRGTFTFKSLTFRRSHSPYFTSMNLATRAFEIVTRGCELVTGGFELLTRSLYLQLVKLIS